jgi:hypothetical protein
MILEHVPWLPDRIWAWSYGRYEKEMAGTRVGESGTRTGNGELSVSWVAEWALRSG